MKYCPTCKSEYSDKFRFCRLDGRALVERSGSASVEQEGEGQPIGAAQSYELPKEAVVTQDASEALKDASWPSVKYCPTCKSEYADRFRFCRLDGTALLEKQVSGTARTEAKEETQYTEARRTTRGQTLGGSVDRSPHDAKPRQTEEGLHSKPKGSERFELLAQEEIKRAFPSAFVRSGVQVRSLKRTAEVDLFVLLPKGLFLIECKNYSGKISGSLNYDQEKGEFWTCETPSGEIVELKSSGKNPAQQALSRFHALHDLAGEAWGEENRPYIHPVLLFPDGADLSGVIGLPIYPEKPSTRDRVVGTTLSKIIPYLANGDAQVEPMGALKLIDFLGIPRSSLSGTWLEQPFKTEEKPAEEVYFEEDSSSSQEPEGSVAEHQYSFDQVPPREQRHPSTRRALGATTAVVVAALLLFIIGRWIFYPGPTKPPDLASLKERPLQQPPEGSASPSLVPETQYPPATPGSVVEPPPTIAPERDLRPGFLSRGKSTPEVQREKTPPDEKFSSSKSLEPPDTSAVKEAKLRERPVLQRPAEPGTYESIKPTYARREASDSSDIIDELKPGIRFEVIGSEGNWLTVRSKKRQAIVYIKRDDAMFVSAKKSPQESFQEAEARWKKVEIEINEMLLRRGITGVTVSFIGDTTYLRGQVRTENERFAAEQAARSIPEVQHIFNGIWVVP